MKGVGGGTIYVYGGMKYDIKPSKKGKSNLAVVAFALSGRLPMAGLTARTPYRR